jgi:molybdopterin molybdotransferase
LETPIKKEDSKRHFIRGRLKSDAASNRYFVSVPGSQSSGNLAGLSNSNCIIVIPEEMTNPATGEEVECIII